MMPILYETTATSFATNGLGVLADVLSCRVTEERNGAFELTMQYPMQGIHYGEIKLGRILLARPNPTAVTQPFRIFKISRPMSGVVTVYAQHVSYDLAGIPVEPYTAGSAAQAVAGLETHAAIAHPYQCTTDVTTVANFAVEVPQSIRATLGGVQGSILDVYGGEYEFDRYQVKLHSARGANRGVSIRYGKNLTDLEQDENCESVYTGVYPYYKGEDAVVTLPEKIIYAEGTYPQQRVLSLDCTEALGEDHTEADLRSYAQRYMERNKIGVPKVSLTVSFVQLEQSGEYADKALLERVNLCDTVNVEFPALHVSATAKCIKTVYDAILERYVSVSLGDARTDLADRIIADRTDTEEQIENVKRDVQSAIQAATENATDWITGGKGYVVINKNAAGNATEILIMDQPDIETATKVWRWNNGGLGYSATGYNGPYTTAITQDGAIVADFITTGTLTASIIKSGVLTDANGKFEINLDTGTITIKDSNGVTALSFSPSTGLTINGEINSNSGNIGGFSISQAGLIGGVLRLNSTGTIDVGTLALRSPSVGVQEIVADVGDLSIGAPNGVYIGGEDAFALYVTGTEVYVKGQKLSPVVAGTSYCSGTWSYLPDDVRYMTSMVASCADSSGYIIKTRYNGGWQWCIDGSSSLSCTACYIAAD